MMQPALELVIAALEKIREASDRVTARIQKCARAIAIHIFCSGLFGRSGRVTDRAAATTN